MNSIRDDDPSASIPHRAAGYRLVDGKVEQAIPIDMSNRMAAGGFVTTIDDLARFSAAVLSDRLVTRQARDLMFTSATLRNGEKTGYGFGWSMELEAWHDDTWVYHGGSTAGFSGIVTLMPRHKFAVAFLTNMEELPGRSELAEGITRVVLGFKAAQ